MATVIAPSVIMLRVISIWRRHKTAMSSDNGMEMMEIMVERMLRRNSRMMSTANKAPKTALDSMVFTESSIGLP
ncbi:hypothetical protein D3C81_2017420 [compost metagenome]